jgi:hypothetical protein
MISNTQIQKLKVLLKEHIATLEGAFVNKNAGYEIAICKNFGFKEQTNRYWDCLYEEENLFIEFKKGTSIWLDLVRYSEILLKKNYDAKLDTFTLFFIPDNNRYSITTIIGIETSKIIEKVKLNKESAENLLTLKDVVPRSLNAQASLTVKDIREIKDFIVNR